MAMQILLDMLKALIAMIAAAALSQFGVELQVKDAVDREVERVQVCTPEQAAGIKVSNPTDC